MKGQTIRALIPNQIAGRLVSKKTQSPLRAFEIINIDTWTLVRIFVSPQEFMELGVAEFIEGQTAKNAYVLTFTYNAEQDYSVLSKIEKA